MGTIAIQNQCCLSKRDDEQEDSDDGSAQEGTAVQLVDSVSWRGRGGGTRAGQPVSSPATNLSRSPQRDVDHLLRSAAADASARVTASSCAFI